MDPILFAIVVGFTLFLILLSWKVALLFAGITGALIFAVGLSPTLTLVSGYILLLLLFKPKTAFILGGFILSLSTITNFETAIGITSLIFVLIILVSGISIIYAQESLSTGIIKASTVIFAFLISRFSTFVNRIEILGYTFPISSIFETIFSIYPGEEFSKELRKEFVDQGVKFVKDGSVEIEEQPEQLARDIRRAYDNSGQLLSDGEAFLALTLVLTSLVPLLPKGLSLPVWLTPPSWLGIGLSSTLLLAVGLRTAALDSLMYSDVTIEEDPAKLAAMKGWNQYMSNGNKILKNLFETKAIMTLSPKAFKFYLRWAFEESIHGDGVSSLKLFSQADIFLIFVFADLFGKSPEQMSKRLFDENRVGDYLDSD